MGEMHNFKASGKTFGQPPLDQQRRRPQEDDPERKFFPAVLIKALLDDLAPARNFLDLIKDKQSAGSLGKRLPGVLPLLGQP